MTKNYMSWVLLSVACIAILGGRIFGQQEPEPKVGKSGIWAGMKLDGLILELKSKTELRLYQFHAPNTVSASVGDKKGGTAAPIWYYRVSGEWFQILREDGKLEYQMLPVKVSSGEIAVDNGRGVVEIFEIKH